MKSSLRIYFFIEIFGCHIQCGCCELIKGLPSMWANQVNEQNCNYLVRQRYGQPQQTVKSVHANTHPVTLLWAETSVQTHQSLILFLMSAVVGWRRKGFASSLFSAQCSSTLRDREASSCSALEGRAEAWIIKANVCSWKCNIIRKCL